ncbi:arylsulfatase [Deltaproteobacteria bacterium]|nr:arylsulfatase [Deltaproteobacteria bacterium]
MTKQLVLINTVSFIADMFRPLLKEQLPEVNCLNIVDEGILHEVGAAGGLTPHIIRRVASQTLLAADLRPGMILFTCSATSPAVDTVRKITDVPIMKIDDPLARVAVESGPRIGFIGTTIGSLVAGQELIRAWSVSLKKDVEITPDLHVDAFSARQAGDIKKHDAIIRDAAVQLGKTQDVVVLGQASMAHLAEPLAQSLGKPVLGSIPLCLQELKKFYA